MQVTFQASLDYETRKKLEQMARDGDENMSEILRRLISQEWNEKGYTTTPQPEWNGEGIS